VTTFATGLAFPSSMQQLTDGSLIVLTTAPNGLWGPSDGRILRLVDADGDGVADGPPQVLASGLPGVATSMRIAGELVFVSAQERGSEGIHILRVGATPGDSYTWLGSMDFSFTVACPNNPSWVHPNNALAVRALPSPPATVELYFNLGSEDNLETCGTIVASGLLAGLPGTNPIDAESIYRVRVTDGGGVPVVSNLEKIASGLRNAAGLAFDPETGDLYFQDNAANTPPPGDFDEALAADELNRIAASDLGGAVEDFGFPTDYVLYRTGGATTGTSIQPIVAFQPVPDPNTGAESEGAVEIAFAPPGFPSALQGGIFVGFHGRFALAGVANEENPVVFADPGSGSHFHFIGNDEPALGHPNGLLATDDGLYVADFSTNGTFGGADLGAIYRIRALNVVPALSPVGSIVLAVLLLVAASTCLVRRRASRA
jgi:glucose/arabinose dehydrogenase